MSDGNHILTVAGAFLAVLIIGGALLIWPSHRHRSAMKAEIADLEVRVAGLEETTLLAEHLADELHQARREMTDSFKIIPDAPDVASLMRRLSLRVDGVSVTDQTFSAGATRQALPADEGAVRALPLNIEIQATFDAVFAVLRAAETMDRLVRITNVRLIRDREKAGPSGEPVLTASISVEALYDPAPGSAAEQ